MLVSPSLLSADFLHIGDAVRLLNAHADLIHLDLMDGVLVPNLSFGFSVSDAVCSAAAIPTDAHLMTVHPWRWFAHLQRKGVRYISFHLEAAGGDAAQHLAALRGMGVKAGLAIDPDVPVHKLYPYIGMADFFVIMSVYAGFGGQKFIPESIGRIAALKSEILRRGDSALIEVDGGVSVSNAQALREAGAGILVAGSAVFGAPDPAAVIRSLKRPAVR
ncbi:MAG: ribulose-phosphate 3-epimerase [Bacteroidales bacterium]|nr:ribulose-phosphate 3-epimerase [Bacteroidales bacterium]